jgi:dihydroorotate dehydrogenase (fumarate)
MDLTTTYLGLRLKNPLVASASPLTRDIDSIRRLEDAGAAAVVLPSIFEEQIRHETEETERLVEKGSDSNPEAMSGRSQRAGAQHVLRAERPIHRWRCGGASAR